MERTVEFLLKTAAEHDARIRQIDERHLQVEDALAKLVGVVDRLAQSQIELRAAQVLNETGFRETDERMRATDERINKLIQAIERTARGNGHRAGSR